MKSSTEIDYRRRIARVIAAIVSEPSAQHSVESLAAIAHFSPYHFHRLYRAVIGESVAATVRRLRLAQAAQNLNGPCVSITDAAFEAGYESPQSFARAFRTLTGLSPTAFQVQQKLMSSPLQQVTIIERAPTPVLALRHDGPPATIPHSFRRLRRWAVERGIKSGSVTRVGFGYGDPEQGEGFEYFAGLVISEGITATDGLEQLELSGGHYVAHRLIGSYALIPPTFQTLYGAWLPQSGLEPDDRPFIELYLNDPALVGENQLATDLLIPIRGTAGPESRAPAGTAIASSAAAYEVLPS